MVLQGAADRLVNVTVTDFRLSTNQKPLRLAPAGKCQFVPLLLNSKLDWQTRKMKHHGKVMRGYDRYWGTHSTTRISLNLPAYLPTYLPRSCGTTTTTGARARSAASAG